MIYTLPPHDSDRPRRDGRPESGRWQLGQRVGLFCQWLHGQPALSSNPSLNLSSYRIRTELARTLNAKDPGGYGLQSFLRGLSPATLGSLARVTAPGGRGDEELRRFDGEVREALSFLTDPKPPEDKTGLTRPSRVIRAQTWATHAMLSHAGARRLMRLGGRADFFGAAWHILFIDRGAEPELKKALGVIRGGGPASDTPSRCRAIDQLAEALRPGPKWAKDQVENALMHHQFAWPLLLIRGAREVPCTIPIAVDFMFSSGKGRHYRVLGEDGPWRVSDWEPQMDRIAQAAKTLWASKHGNHMGFREKVWHEGVAVFDFTWAQRIATASETYGSLRLTDRSADAYLVQAVINRIIGTTVFQSAVAVGGVGSQMLDEDRLPSLNFTLDEPDDQDGLERKLRFAAEHGGYTTVVLPNRAKRLGYAAPDGLDIEHVGHLQQMTDRLQITPWRQYRYSRCPEIRWSLHFHRQRGGRPIERSHPATSEGVKAVLKSLGANEAGAVLDLEASALDVASAIWHVNTAVRLRDAVGPDRLRDADPSLSWTFVRVRDDESDEQFWHQVLAACGLTLADDDPHLTQGREAFTKAVTRTFNTFAPYESRPGVRAPDLLVVVGAQHLRTNADGTLSETRPLLIPPVLKALNCNLLPVTQSQLRSSLGHTRVILVNDRSADYRRGGWGRIDELDAADKLLLQILSTFRYGFTGPQAAFLLRRHPALKSQTSSTDALKRRLMSICRAGRLRYIDGMYHVSPATSSEIRERSLSPHERAKNHYYTGWALAPYVRSDDDLGISVEAVFDSELRWEAESHFDTALQAASIAVAASRRSGRHAAQNAKIQRDVWHARQTLFTYSEVPSWRSVGRHLSSQSPVHAASLADDLIETAEGAIHPLHVQIAAAAHSQVSRAFDGEQSELAARRAGDLYDSAIAGAKRLERRSSGPVEASVRSHVGEVLGYDDETVRREGPLASKLIHEATPAEIENLPFHSLLFSKAGDLETDDAEAHRLYLAGTVVRPDFFHNIVKSLGTAPDDDVEAAVRALDQDGDLGIHLGRLNGHISEAPFRQQDSPIWDRWLSPTAENVDRTVQRTTRGLERIAEYSTDFRTRGVARRAAEGVLRVGADPPRPASETTTG